MPADSEAREKWSAYPNTILAFAAPEPLRVDLRTRVSDEQRRALAAAGWANPFAVFTAENPSGDHAEDTPTADAAAAKERKNRDRRGALRGELRARGLRLREVEASAPNGEYSEQCVAVDVALADARRIAREFDQLALFWYDGTVFWLVPAKLGETPVALPGAIADD